MLTHYFLGLVTTGLLGFDNLAAAVLLRSQPDGIFPSIRPQDGDVPSVNGYPRCSDAWFGIGQELQDWFIDDEGLCTDLAAQAVRLPFHDCFPDGGCDGSIILSDECTTRSENRQMIPICGVLYKISVEWRVGAADLINFAASVANKACPYGPYIPFYIGRKDNDTSAPKDQIPPSFSTAPDLVKAFQARNFTAYDLVAMVGSHSCGGNLSFVPFDTTPGAMDSPTYYTEVLTGEAPATMPSDKSLALDPSTTNT
ncbi:unnamed protein product [Discula destructiva]